MAARKDTKKEDQEIKPKEDTKAKEEYSIKVKAVDLSGSWTNKDLQFKKLYMLCVTDHPDSKVAGYNKGRILCPSIVNARAIKKRYNAIFLEKMPTANEISELTKIADSYKGKKHIHDYILDIQK